MQRSLRGLPLPLVLIHGVIPVAHYMKTDDHIRVKNGTQDPDFKGKDLSGYTGYIEEIDGKYVTILWDEATLSKFERKFKKKCDRKGLDHTRMVLCINEIALIDEIG